MAKESKAKRRKSGSRGPPRRQNTQRGTIVRPQAGKQGQMVKQRYVCVGAVSIAASSSGYLTLSLNSLYDPEVTVSGGRDGQPKGFDQLAAMWERYLVHAVSWKVSLTGESILQSYCAVVPHQTELGGYVAGLVGTAAEFPGGEAQILHNGAESKFEGYLKMKHFFGVEQLDVGLHGAAVSASPTTRGYLNIPIYNETAATREYFYVVDLQYYSEFSITKNMVDA